jgi:hypothetical protein
MMWSDIPQLPLPFADLIIGNNRRIFLGSEVEHFALSVKESGSASIATQALEAASSGSLVVDSGMRGMTANAATARFDNQAAALTSQGVRHTNNATNTAMMGMLFKSSKTKLNLVASAFITEWEALKVRAVAEGMTQAEFNSARDTLIETYQGKANQVGADHDESERVLTDAIKTNAEPSVPSKMSTAAGVPGGLSPEVTQQLGQLTGMASSAGQALSGTLGGLLSNPPGAAAAQQLLESLTSGAGGESAGLTSKLDEVLGGDGGAKLANDADAAGGGDDPIKTMGSESGGGGDHAEGDGHDHSQEASGGGAEPAKDGDSGVPTVIASEGTESVAPSPAAVPVSGGEAASAVVPTTELSGSTSGIKEDSGVGTPMGSGGMGSPAGSGEQSVSRSQPMTPTVAAVDSGTELSSGTPNGSALSAAGAAGGAVGSSALGGSLTPAGAAGAVGPAGIGAGAGTGLAPAMGAVPASAAPVMAPMAPLAPTTPPAPGSVVPPQAPVPSTPPTQTGGVAPASATPVVPGTGYTQAPALVGPPSAVQQGALLTGLPALPALPAHPGSVHHPDSGYTAEQRWAGAVLATLISEMGRGGFASPMAAALLPDGTTVFSTSDGLGFLPHGTRVPERTIPLSEYPGIGTLFREDMTGCTRPGFVIKLAADLGMIPPPVAIVATDSVPCEGVSIVSPSSLTGSPYLNTPVTRDLFGKIEAEDVALALESLKQVWGFDPDMYDSEDREESVETALAASRWESVNNPDAVRALAEFLLTDAERALSRGEDGECAYVLRQLLHLTNH